MEGMRSPISRVLAVLSCAAALGSTMLGACRPSSGPAVDLAVGGPDGGATQVTASGERPAVDRTCTRDDECAVARIDVGGKTACCPSCATTPGTRRWHAALQLSCADSPLTACGPLACPEGPTRAVCRAGRCEATATGADGGPTRVPVERRCLPAMVCDDWVGCAFATGNRQDGYFTSGATAWSGARRPIPTPGTLADVRNVCTIHEKCEGVWTAPPKLACPPWTAPPMIGRPTYTCVEEGLRCVAKEK